MHAQPRRGLDHQAAKAADVTHCCLDVSTGTITTCTHAPFSIDQLCEMDPDPSTVGARASSRANNANTLTRRCRRSGRERWPCRMNPKSVLRAMHMTLSGIRAWVPVDSSSSTCSLQPSSKRSSHYFVRRLSNVSTHMSIFAGVHHRRSLRGGTVHARTVCAGCAEPWYWTLLRIAAASSHCISSSQHAAHSSQRVERTQSDANRAMS